MFRRSETLWRRWLRPVAGPKSDGEQTSRDLDRLSIQPAHHALDSGPLDPAAGERAPVADIDHPVGAGSTPRFALFAPADADRAELLTVTATCSNQTFVRPLTMESGW